MLQCLQLLWKLQEARNCEFTSTEIVQVINEQTSTPAAAIAAPKPQTTTNTELIDTLEYCCLKATFYLLYFIFHII